MITADPYNPKSQVFRNLQCLNMLRTPREGDRLEATASACWHTSRDALHMYVMIHVYDTPTAGNGDHVMYNCMQILNNFMLCNSHMTSAIATIR